MDGDDLTMKELGDRDEQRADAWVDAHMGLESGTSSSTWGDAGEHMTCTEADAVAAALRSLDLGHFAEALIEGHALSDEEGDAHYRG